MKPKLIAIFLLIVVLPLALLAWLGLSLARTERDRAQNRFRRVVTDRLSDIGNNITLLVQDRERELLKVHVPRSEGIPGFRRVARKQRLVKQVFILDADGKILYPLVSPEATEQELDFLDRTAAIWTAGVRFPRSGDGTRRAAGTHGWYTWFWGNGVNFVFWRKNPSGGVTGMEVDRMALMSDILAILPAQEAGGYDDPLSRIELSNAKNEVIYLWGHLEQADGQVPLAELALVPPLNAWKLKYFVSGPAAGDQTRGSALFNVFSGLALAALSLVLLAGYFYRESSRAMNEAAQRVSFVNQVSHELKTPLTNIRLYGELLQESVPESETKTRERADIIVNESERLSRLISNVLTFARKQKGGLNLRMGTGRIDDVIAGVLDSFRPSLARKAVEIRFDADAGETVRFDADAFGQMLGNLLSNVEKYAVSGKLLEVVSRQDGDMTTVTVVDRGPGIPQEQAERIFEPFTRLSNKLTDGVSGTGMGLGIARDLARLHGGDLVLEPSETGTRFVLTLKTTSRPVNPVNHVKQSGEAEQ